MTRTNLPEKYPAHLGESTDSWTDRLLTHALEHGTYRQCSIGWHGECSQRHLGAEGKCNCTCHEPAPEPEKATRKILIEWFHTETFRAEVEVEDDFELENLDADEVLMGIIDNMDERELSHAFMACTDKQIFKSEEVTQ